MHLISFAYCLVECLKLKFISIDRKAIILDFNEKTDMAFVEEQMFCVPDINWAIFTGN